MSLATIIFHFTMTGIETLVLCITAAARRTPICRASYVSLLRNRDQQNRLAESPFAWALQFNPSSRR